MLSVAKYLLVLMLCILNLVAQDTQENSVSSHYASWTNPKLEVRSTPSGKRGMFSTNKIDKDERLAVFGGTVITRKQVLQLSKESIPCVLQISDDLWITSGSNTLEPIDYINHSCNPNAGMRGHIFLVAMRDIEPNEEVTFDYAMVVSEWIGMDPISCDCGSSECRKIVLHDDWKNKRLQAAYKGYFAQHMQEKIELLGSRD